MTVTNGTIEFSRRVRTGDFEHKDAKVSLSYTVAEGESWELVTAKVAVEARSFALQMVGETPPNFSPVNAVEVAEQAPSPLPESSKSAEVVIGAPTSTVPGEPGSAAVPTTASLNSQPPTAVSDADLVTAITHKNAKLGEVHGDASPAMIGRLVAEFVPPPAKAQSIPQEHRQAFLDKLAALA